jgi:signal transduction histidine kinase
MRLTAKLVAALMLGILLVIVVNGYLDIRHEVRTFHELADDKARTVGDAMDDILVVAWRDRGREGALELIRSVNQERHDMELRWVWFDAAPGDPYCPTATRELLIPAALDEHRPVAARRPDGADYLHIYWPIPVEEGRAGGLEFAEPMSELDTWKKAAVYRTLLQMLATALVAGAMTVAMGITLVGKPLEKLIAKTRRIGSGDLSGPVHLSAHDELAELAESMNEMCEKLDRSQSRIRKETTARIAAMEQLRHADRLKTVGRLAAGMAHELGTPLNVVAGRAGLIVSGRLSADETSQSAQAIKVEAEKMTAILRQLLDFARRHPPKRVSVDLRRVAAETVGLLSGFADKRQVTLSLAEEGGPQAAMVDVGQIQQVLTNLIVNAIQAMPDGGGVEIDVVTRRAQAPEERGGRQGDYLVIEVSDRGAGVQPEDMEHLFEPFFTTKDVGEGTGLGLSIAYGIVQEHGGWIDVTSEPDKGSTFRVYLPKEPERETADSDRR